VLPTLPQQPEQGPGDGTEPDLGVGDREAPGRLAGLDIAQSARSQAEGRAEQVDPSEMTSDEVVPPVRPRAMAARARLRRSRRCKPAASGAVCAGSNPAGGAHQLPLPTATDLGKRQETGRYSVQLSPARSCFCAVFARDLRESFSRAVGDQQLPGLLASLRRAGIRPIIRRHRLTLMRLPCNQTCPPSPTGVRAAELPSESLWPGARRDGQGMAQRQFR
jgi:hypothetical protein